MKPLFIVIFSVTITVSKVHSQNRNRCSSMQMLEQLLFNAPGVEKNMKEMERDIHTCISSSNHPKQSSSIIIIPIVVHVVYNTSAENISDEQIYSQIDALNNDFRRLNADAGNTNPVFQAVATDCEIEFCLATRNPDGLPTNGITRTYTSVSGFTTNAMKFDVTGGKNAWNSSDYLNIWVCNFINGLGFAQFPGGPANTDGVVINYTAFGNQTGTATYPYDRGRTATHEIGHWLHLWHTFQDSCGNTIVDSTNCLSWGDLVCDTPPEAEPHYGCPSSDNSCNNDSPDISDMLQNYMEYVYDNCMNLFTEGQKSRMHATLNTARSSIQSSSGCAPLYQIDAAINAIVSPDVQICDTVIFPLISLINWGTDTLTSVTINYQTDGGLTDSVVWSGGLATADTSNIILPAFAVQPGAHIYKVFTSYPNGTTDFFLFNDTFTVNFTAGTTATLTLPFTEGFETSGFPPPDWTNENQAGNLGWEKTTTVSGFGNSAAAITKNNYDFANNNIGDADIMLSPYFDFSSAMNAQMKFNIAYARYSAAWYDSLSIYYSADCGNNWNIIWAKGKDSLATASDNTSLWFPADNQWRQEIIELTSLAGESGTQFKFENICGFGNNLFIDDIHIDVSTGINYTSVPISFSVFPNPSSGNFTVRVSKIFPDAEILIYDVTGQLILKSKLHNQSQAGFNEKPLKPGMYYVLMNNRDYNIVRKITVIR